MDSQDIITDSPKRQVAFDALKDIKRISELDYTPTKKYRVATKEETLDKLIAQHQVIVVGGSFFGDEGKGKIVDAVARHPDVKMVMRANGGQNAGHTVVIDGVQHVLHIIPSGIFVPDTTAYIGSECVFDPVTFVQQEVQALIDGNINYKDKLFIGNAHIVTPYHKLMDLARNYDNLTNDCDFSQLRINDCSTMQGIAPVHKSKSGKEGPRLINLFGDENKLRAILKKDLQNYFGMLAARNIDEDALRKVARILNSGNMRRIPQHAEDFLATDDKVGYLIELFDTTVRNNPLFPNYKDVKHEVQTKLAQGEKLLLEGSQSYWLSNKVEQTWSQSTSADTSISGIIAAADIKADNPLRINIHKAPGSSRVGRGPNPSGFVEQHFYSLRNWLTLNDLEGRCIDFDTIQRQFWDAIGENGLLEPKLFEDASGLYSINAAMAIAQAREYKECGATTKKPRSMGLFDCLMHAAAMRAQGPYTSISAVDRGDILSNMGIVVAYVHYNPHLHDDTHALYKNGQIIRATDAYPPYDVTEHCYPIIKKIQGWQDEPLAHTYWNTTRKLPQGVQEFIGCVEHFTGAHVFAIGNGPEAGHIIYVTEDKETPPQATLRISEKEFISKYPETIGLY